MSSNPGLFQDSSEFFKVLLSHHTQSTLICGHADHPGYNTFVMLLYVQKYAHILLDEILFILSLKKIEILLWQEKRKPLWKRSLKMNGRSLKWLCNSK